ncbi:MAG TPA: hypothetical protein VN742_06055, partial [Candidatus Binataceae bacterium]|nr:hypothetical protein [Candidatus Binataceae bacterium]
MAETRREEQKLWLILFQIKAIRTRLNLLAIQFWLFTTLAVLIGAAALIYLSAMALNPLLFLTTAILVGIFAIAATVRIARAALRQGANPGRAAAVADQRADLKGRLATVLALAEAPPASSLWPYLVEDTYTLRHKFEPSKVEPRWVSRSVLAPATVLVMIAAVLLGLKYYRRDPAFTADGPPTEITADLGNLEISPADPSHPANARVYSDPATLRQLEAKLAQAEKEDPKSNGITRWMNKARKLAGSLQDQVTGQTPGTIPPLALKLQGAKAPPAGADSGPVPRAGDRAGNHPDSASIMPPENPDGGGPAAGADQRPPVTIPPEDADRLAQNGLPSMPGDNSAGSPEDQAGAKVGSGYAGEAGPNHSAGADPEHLFGAP